MPKVKYIIFALVLVTAIVLKTLIAYLDEDLILQWQGHPLIFNFLDFVYFNQFGVVLACELIPASQIILGVLLYPRHYIKKRKERLVKNLFSELFKNDISHHRVTLFKEVNYPYAIWRYVCSLFYHLFRPKYFFRFKVHLRSFPAPGNYLIVYIRQGSYRNSRTMFRVEDDDVKKCQGIVGFCRFQKADTVLVCDLPDITNIDLEKVDLKSPKRNETKLVKEYMHKGHIRSMDVLKLLHLRARHFLCSVIYKDTGVPWGMILVDSTEDKNPYPQETVEKFRIYSRILTDLVS